MDFVTNAGQIIPIVSGTTETVMWLGAGFSRAATDGAAPLMSDFFSTLDPECSPCLTKYLTSRFGSPQSANVESALQAVEQLETAALPQRLKNSILSGQDPKKIKRELEAFCLKRLNYELNPQNWAIRLLAHANERTTVVTTNYDLIADQVLSRRSGATHCTPIATCHHCNMMALLSDGCSCQVTPARTSRANNAALFKIHGSLAWHTCTNIGCRICQCLVPRCDCTVISNPICGCCGEPSHPVLLLPSMVKHYNQFPQIERMWVGMEDALARATTVTIIGFSFPASDCLVCDVFRSGLDRGRQLQDVLIIDLDPSSVAGRVRSMVPRDMEVRIHELQVPRDGSTPTWARTKVAAAGCG